MDINQRAHRVVLEATASQEAHVKDKMAVDLGRRGGLVGGRARAEALNPEQRSEIAKKAAKARWNRKGKVI